MLEKVEKLQIFCTGILISIALIITAIIITKSTSNNTITVTGSAYEIVKSDTGSIDFEINIKNKTKQGGYAELQKQIQAVKKYLENKKIKDIELQSINTYAEYKRNFNGNYTNEIDYYNMTQPVKIKSDNVELIKEISTDLASLINQGIDIRINYTSYNYSKLADLKVKLLEKASQDAKNRAMSMLKPTGSSIGKVQSVKMGVYQITTTDSTEVTDGGINDTSSIDKKVTAVTNIAFKIK